MRKRIGQRHVQQWLVVAGLGFLVSASAACSYLRTGGALDALNHPSEAAGVPTHEVAMATRISRLTRAHLADAYLEPAQVATWMKRVGAEPERLLRFYQCLVNRGSGTGDCYEAFVDETVTPEDTPPWGLPRVPADATARSIAVEVDVERFLANLMGVAPTLSALRSTMGTDISVADLRSGIKRGAEEAAAYVTNRGWKRRLGRPANAIVISGGAANGAFSAGVVWRLMSILRGCRGEPSPRGCGDAHVDIVAGSSTGALIGTIFDVFHSPRQEEAAMGLLVDSYTCSVESDLYCLNSTWIWRVASNLKGLVRFDGIERKLEKTVNRAMMENPMELVTVSVDYASGDVYGLSDQDPADLLPLEQGADPWNGRVRGERQAILASIVEPVLAEPVSWVPSAEGRLHGTFIDGGIRSGLPLLQAVQRGAERTLVLASSGIEPGSAANQAHAVSILMRTLDLLVSQPRVGEVQQGELQAVTRRLVEYNVCDRRQKTSTMFSQVPDKRQFCRRSGPDFEPPRPGAQAATPMWLGPARFDEVATSWRSVWMFRPTSPTKSASGYAFEPKVMRPLFESGVAIFQARCREILDLFEVRGEIAAGACQEPVESVVAKAHATFKEIGTCTHGKPPRRTCD